MVLQCYSCALKQIPTGLWTLSVWDRGCKQLAGWWEGNNGYPNQLLSCAVGENQLLSCKYGGYDYLDLGPAIIKDPDWLGWYPLLSNKSGPGSRYFSTNGSSLMEVVINACQCQVKHVLGIEIMDNIPYYLESLIYCRL
jgi:hypothetical protein